MASVVPPSVIPREERFQRKPRNGCSGCRQDFASVSLFDRHRVGSFEHNWSPDREDGRRCLSIEEIQDKGWELDARGRWVDPVRAQRAREAFSAVGRTPESPGEDDAEEMEAA
jgi:hypothetical protein